MKAVAVGMMTVMLGLGAMAAGATENYKIGFVSTEKVLREAAPALKAQKKIEKEFLVRDQELQKMAKQVQDLRAALEKEGVTIPETDRRNKERDLANQTRELQRAQREFNEDLNLRKNEELSMVLERANKAIRAIAEAEKFDLILQEAVFRSDRIDITDKVIKVLAEKDK